jgi:hypothetical protein
MTKPDLQAIQYDCNIFKYVANDLEAKKFRVDRKQIILVMAQSRKKLTLQCSFQQAALS